MKCFTLVFYQMTNNVVVKTHKFSSHILQHNVRALRLGEPSAGR
jgi:hypothetical protein